MLNGIHACTLGNYVIHALLYTLHVHTNVHTTCTSLHVQYYRHWEIMLYIHWYSLLHTTCTYTDTVHYTLQTLGNYTLIQCITHYMYITTCTMCTCGLANEVHVVCTIFTCSVHVHATCTRSKKKLHVVLF